MNGTIGTMRKVSSDELLHAARRALAFAYAAIDRPSRKRVQDARSRVMRLLAAIDRTLCGGEIGELVAALERVAAALTGIEVNVAT
jgi:hypothetical protein